MTDIIADTSLRDLWEDAAVRLGDKTFLIFQDRDGVVSEFSYRAFNDEINRTANLFLDLGVVKGDRVLIQMCSSPEFIMCLFALAKLGALMVPVDERSSQAECHHVLTTCGVRLAVIEEHLLSDYRELQAQGDLLADGIVIARCAEGSAELPRFDVLKAHQPTILKQGFPLASEDPVEILFTSGTTSQPKGVILTHANLLFSGVYGAWQTSLRQEDRLLTTMPACHSNFQLAALTPVLTVGATLILIERYSARNFWKQLRQYRATVTQCVSMMVRTLLMQPVRPDERDHCLREILYFMPLLDCDKQAFEERFGVRLMNSYGSTESVTWIITDPPYGERRWPSVGRAGLGYEVCIKDEDGKVLPPYGIGEICVKGVFGRSLMAGYYADAEATARTLMADGWMRTGDTGYRDEDGWFYFVDRAVNLIKRSGVNISATEIEMMLVTHPKIAEAAVIGVPDPLRDEAVKAFILPEEGESITVDEVVDYCQKNLAAYKVPTIVEIRTSLPRTCSMKIEKKQLA